MLFRSGTGSKVRPVVSCKGTTCQYGIIDTFDLSEEMHYRFFNDYANVKLPHKFKMAVGGCPNNCVKPDLNDLGVVGQHVPKIIEDKCIGCKTCQIESACPLKIAKVKGQNGEKFDEDYIAYAPFFINEWRNLNPSAYESIAHDSNAWGMAEVSVFAKFKDKIVSSRSMSISR